jgi:glycosyltransferase involved in cell wall biosynthesis
MPRLPLPVRYASPAVEPSTSFGDAALRPLDATPPAPTRVEPLVLIANPSPDVYGSDLQMLETVTALRDAGYRVKVVIPSDGPLVPRLRARGAEVIHAEFPVLRRANLAPLAFLQLGLSVAAAVPRLARLVRRTSPTVVYVNTVTLPWWLFAARLARVPATCHVHEADDMDSRPLRFALYGPLWLANTILINSQPALDVMERTIPRLVKKARVIYNGISQPPDEPKPARRNQPFKLLSVGRLSPRKAPHLALEAVGRLRSRGYDVRIELAGSVFPGNEWYLEELKERANRPDLAGAVSFAGYCSPIWPNLQRADLVVQPSLRESLGNAVIEAQMSLRPVVATATSGHLVTITDGETGLLFPSGDVNALVDAIARMIDDDDLAAGITRRALTAASERFSINRYAAETVSAIESIVVTDKRPVRSMSTSPSSCSIQPQASTRHAGSISSVPTVRILGTHGVPGSYGGFETAAENIGLYLRQRGWRVVVYCQLDGDGPTEVDEWNGLERVKIRESKPGWRGTAAFDLKSIRHAMSVREAGDVWLTLGYNTGAYNVLPRLRGIPNVINMDGMEWTRKRWGLAKQGILLANERFAGAVGNVLIADHPVIATYLCRNFGKRRVRTIAYGAPEVTDAPTGPVTDLGLTPAEYGMIVCRPIPENSILEIVTAWSKRRRGMRLLVVGPYGDDDPYQVAVRAAASVEVLFPGAIFEPDRLQALRYHSALYLHGHTVGGTNPSLVEAMAAANAVIAHNNRYNTWVAGPGNAYFNGTDDLDTLLTDLVGDPVRRRRMGKASLARFREEFTWQRIGAQYEEALNAALKISRVHTASRMRGASHA